MGLLAFLLNMIHVYRCLFSLRIAHLELSGSCNFSTSQHTHKQNKTAFCIFWWCLPYVTFNCYAHQNSKAFLEEWGGLLYSNLFIEFCSICSTLPIRDYFLQISGTVASHYQFKSSSTPSCNVTPVPTAPRMPCKSQDTPDGYGKQEKQRKGAGTHGIRGSQIWDCCACSQKWRLSGDIRLPPSGRWRDLDPPQRYRGPGQRTRWNGHTLHEGKFQFQTWGKKKICDCG